MKKLGVLIFFSVFSLGLFSQKMKQNSRIEILDDEALQLIDKDAKIEIIADGFKWTEGPLYVEDGDYLLFSDIPNNAVFKLDSEGQLSEYLKPSGYSGNDEYGDEPGSNGLLLNSKGELILMQHGNRQVARMKGSLISPKAEYETLADKYQGERLNSPNDGVFDAEGNLYFTDPPYGLPKKMEDPNKELDFQGLFCLKKNGELILVDKLSRPNGVALSNDGSKLYVAVSNPDHAVWYEYDVLEAGKAVNKRIFYDVTELIGKQGEQGLPDGMKMHSKDYIFATGPGGVWIFNLEGKALARIHTGEKTANCAFDANEKWLFMTADDFILKVGLK